VARGLLRPVKEKMLNILDPCKISVFVSLLRQYRAGVASFILVLLFCPLEAYSAQLTFSWQPSTDPDVAGYRLFCRRNGQGYDYSHPAWEGTGTTCVYEFDAAVDATYCYVVRAFDTAGNESTDSNEACWTAPAFVLESLSITGPASVREGDTASYVATATFSNGDTGKATNTAVWAVEPDAYGSISSGWLTTRAVPSHQIVTITASYTFGVVAKAAQKEVTIVDVATDDTDGDGLPDWWESKYGLDATSNSGPNGRDGDFDGDGWTNVEEYLNSTDPSDDASYPVTIEAGNVLADDNWQRLHLTETFQDPIVVAKLGTMNGADPAVVRISNINKPGFKVRVQEWDYLDGLHTKETVCYLVLERGSYILADGTRLEAGSFYTSSTSSFCNVSFNEVFDAVPVVVTSVSSFNGSDPVTGRIKEISKEGFKFRMQREQAKPQEHASELITYVAWEPSFGTVGGMTFEINKTDNTVTHDLQAILFDQSFTNTPVLLSNMQTYNGDNTANVRCDNVDLDGMHALINEEQSLDDETSHVSEVVGYMAFSIGD
jgi:hypothetical protein